MWSKTIEIKGTAKTLYEDSFKGIPKLCEIDVAQANLEEIQSETFKNLPHLDILDLSGNNLHEIKSKTFVNLKVHNLYLQEHFIALLQERAFVNLSDVDELNIENNSLQELKRGVFQDLSVRRIELGLNHISRIEVGTFDRVFSGDEQSIHLNLMNNSITEIDPSVFNHKYIIFLGLANNSISVLRPGDLHNLPYMQDIQLMGNKIKQVPEGVFSGSEIRSFGLELNEISFIASKAFDDMKYLYYAGLSNNKLKERNKNRCWLDFRTIYLETMPAEAFTNIPGDSILRLDHNRIRSISDSAFKSVTQLGSIDLSYNELEEWNLRGNRIKCPKEGSNSLVPKAYVVYLSNCPEVVAKARHSGRAKSVK